VWIGIQVSVNFMKKINEIKSFHDESFYTQKSWMVICTASRKYPNSSAKMTYIRIKRELIDAGNSSVFFFLAIVGSEYLQTKALYQALT
jgi:disulfide oxidoreductase YuzD